MAIFLLNKKKLIVSIVIAGLAIIGDKNSENQSNSLAAAICDNTAHALIGAFTWIAIFVSKTYKADFYFCTEIVLCGFLSSLIDADHFIAAKSLSLKEATSLKNRPIMHCTSLLVFITIFVLSVAHFLELNWLFKFGWIFAAAFLSHHIRDSKRRGFWLWPFGSTKPLPNFVYISSQMLLPHLLSFIILHTTPSETFRDGYHTTIETV